MTKHLIRMRNADGMQWLDQHDNWCFYRTEAGRFTLEQAEATAALIREGAGYGVGDYGVHQLQIVEDEPTLLPIAVAQKDDDDYLDESFTVYHIMKTQRSNTPEQIKALVAEEFPSTYCQHEHDCCGNFYYSQGRYVVADLSPWDEQWVTILVSHSATRNI